MLRLSPTYLRCELTLNLDDYGKKERKGHREPDLPAIRCSELFADISSISQLGILEYTNVWPDMLGSTVFSESGLLFYGHEGSDHHEIQLRQFPASFCPRRRCAAGPQNLVVHARLESAIPSLKYPLWVCRDFVLPPHMLLLS